MRYSDIPPCEQMAIEQAKKESSRLYFITTRFNSTKNKENYSCVEEYPYVGNEGLGFSLTPVQEALLRGIANYESIEEMNQKDLTAVVIINQGSFMQFPEVEGIGYEGTYIMLEGKKKDSYLDEEEVMKSLRRRKAIRASRKKKENEKENEMAK